MNTYINFFDKIEDYVREHLSRRPILYTFIGSISIVLFWRGIWMVADSFAFLTGPVSVLISVFLLLVTGLFTSFFVGDSIIISGLKKEKKLIERAESEIVTEMAVLLEIKNELVRLSSRIDEMQKKI